MRERRARRWFLNERGLHEARKQELEEKTQVQLSINKRLLGEYGEFQGHEWIHWQKQAQLFDFMLAAPYAEGEKRLEFDLPGHGSKKPECGKTQAKGCDRSHDHVHGKDFVRLYRRTCLSRECPVCYESWASRAAERAMIRLATYAAGAKTVSAIMKKCLQENRLRSRRIYHEDLRDRLEEEVLKYSWSSHKAVKHFVISPPDPTLVDHSQSSIKKLRLQAQKIARERGVEGGSFICHPYRLRCSNPVCHATIPDFHKKFCPKCGATGVEWFWSVHFHGIGFGWIQGTAQGFEKDGWIVKNLGKRSSVFATFQYVLSHAGVSPGGRGIYTISWFGKLSYRSMHDNLPPELESLRELCPYCEAPLRLMIWLKGLDDPPPEFNTKDEFQNEILAEPGSWRAV